MKIIKTYESFYDYHMGEFEGKINRTKLIHVKDNIYDYDGDLNLTNMDLKSLLNLPMRLRKVHGGFSCVRTGLISLEGSPEIVGGSFLCWGNKLISLQYAPKEVGKGFDCTDNNLLSEKFSSIVNGRINLEKNPFEITENVINTIKRMTFDQRLKELEFFRLNDKDAYEMMKDVMIKENLGFGEETKKIVGVMKDFTNAKEMF